MLEKYIIEATDCDFKQKLELNKPKSWLKTVSAFANGIGGTLFFGVKDDHQICGIDNAQKAAENISRLIKESISPIPDIILRAIKEDNADVLLVEVKPGANTPFYYCRDGIKQAYTRMGNETIATPDHILNELILKGTNRTYDSIATEYLKRNYSFTLLEATYYERTGMQMEPSDYLSFGLSDKNGYLTRGGALLADQSVFRHSRLFCTRWNGLEKGSIFDDALDDKEFSGSLIHLLKNGLNFITNNSKVRFAKEPLYRVDKPDYAIRAIQECLVNALIHRDYLILGSEVHIDMYDDRLEITSPGGMYDCKSIQHMDVELMPSSRRNPVIADIFHRMKYMERRGSGLKKIINETKKLPGYTDDLKPVFYSTHSNFIVIIKNMNYAVSQVSAQVSAQVKSILSFCQTPKTSKEIMAHCQFKSIRYFRQRILHPLIEKNLLSMTIPDKPRSRNQKYVCVKPSNFKQ